MNKLDQLKKMTTIVSDSGEFEEIKQYRPTDATTNPSLIFAASSKPEYQFLIQEAIQWGIKNARAPAQVLEMVVDKLFINFGLEILKIVPGRVSTEVDARLSFDVDGSVKKAHHLISLYEAAGIDRKRILIKLASTWEGIKAAEILEQEGIHCNMTLLFSLPQAIGCAQVGATLISPFVGRILDWYKKSEGKESYPAPQDPGVVSVTEIYNYYKKMGIKTQIMGASFRNAEEITEELQKAEGPVPKKLDAEAAKKMSLNKINLDEKTFRWMLNENAMATEKLSEGIRNFTKDLVKLEKIIQQKI
jgi:transaldolase